MARIGSTGGIAGRNGLARAVRGRAGFALGAEPSGTAAAVAAPAMTAGAGLFALQEDERPGRRNTRAQQRADTLLAELRGLQLDLLGAGLPDRARLDRLRTLEEGEDGADPALREAVRGLALRAAIELARLDPDAFAAGSATIA